MSEFVIKEAEQASDCSSDVSDDELVHACSGSEISDLFDADTDLEEENEHSSLFREQEQRENEEEVESAVLALGLGQNILGKRDHPVTPKNDQSNPNAEDEISPQLAGLSIMPVPGFKKPRRKLFNSGNQPAPSAEDSGVLADCGSVPLSQRAGSESLFSTQNQTLGSEVDGACSANSSQNVREHLLQNGAEPVREEAVDPPIGEENAELEPPQDLYDASITFQRHRLLAHIACQQQIGIKFSNLTRPYNSDRSTSCSWVVFAVTYNKQEALLQYLKQLYVDCRHSSLTGWYNMYYLQCEKPRNRQTVHGHFRRMGCIAVLSNPPEVRNALNSLWWKQNSKQIWGQPPEWMIQNLIRKEENSPLFELSKMVQWALDHNYRDVSTICYEYAKLGFEDKNAELWLKSNSQLHYAKDCAQMVRNYQKAKMMSMTISEFISDRKRKFPEGDKKNIIILIAFQKNLLYEFISTLRGFLHARIKKCTLCIAGVPDSGKSMLATTLMKFLDGKVLNFMNSKSHFWLQPVTEAKVGLIDDGTLTFWDYADCYLRNAFDGNPLTIDVKFHAPMEIKFPPLIITSNYDIRAEEHNGKYKYLTNRVKFINFPKTLPTSRDGNSRIIVKPEDWGDFFSAYAQELDLDLDSEDESDSERAPQADGQDQ